MGRSLTPNKETPADSLSATGDNIPIPLWSSSGQIEIIMISQSSKQL